MKRATATRHLVEMGAAADDLVDRARALGAAPLTELWVTGDLLTPTDTLEWGSVVLVLDLPPDQLTWLARDATAEWVGAQLRLGKRPMGWSYRPAAWPVWNVRDRRLARFWADGAGIDDAAIEALRERQLDRLAVVEAAVGEWTAQLTVELVASRRHLRDVLDHFEDRDWRRAHTGVDESPGDHLWRAAQAVTDLLDALDASETPQEAGSAGAE